MSLAKEYRPESLEDFEGNEILVKSLESVLNKKFSKLPHVFLFSGQKGCGKTTLGRITAKELGCEESEYYEYNAASIRSMDAIREIET